MSTVPRNKALLQLLSVVMPAQNEEDCVASTVEHLHLELRRHNVPHEIIAVDDGSTDATWRMLESLAFYRDHLACYILIEVRFITTTIQNVDTWRISNRTPVFKTPWFELVKKSVENNSAPHYSIRTRDYVSVLATTRDKTFVLVRQFRPAIEMFTLELPGGHVDEGETPEQSARKELLEETGFVAEGLANHELHNTRHTAARRFSISRGNRCRYRLSMDASSPFVAASLTCERGIMKSPEISFRSRGAIVTH